MTKSEIYQYESEAHIFIHNHGRLQPRAPEFLVTSKMLRTQKIS